MSALPQRLPVIFGAGQPMLMSMISGPLCSASSAARAMTAWRVEGTLREFPRFEPVNLLFDYPMHRIDATGALADASPEGEELGRADYRAQGRERKARNDARKQGAKLAALREGIARAGAAIDSGAAAKVLDRWITAARALKPAA